MLLKNLHFQETSNSEGKAAIHVSCFLTIKFYIACMFSFCVFIPRVTNAITISGPIAASSVSVTGDVTIESMTVSTSTINYLRVSTGSLPSFTVVGTKTNDNAPNGGVGEYVSSVVGISSFPATDVWGDLTSIGLTAGDWDVSICGGQQQNGSNTFYFEFAISTTSANSSSGIGVSNSLLTYNPSLIYGQVTSIAPYRMTFATTTTVYFKYLANYDSFLSPTASGRISARRVR